MTVLEKIAAHVAKRLVRLKRDVRPAELPFYARAPRDFASNFPGVIAEVKFASPSEGLLQQPSAEAAVRIAGEYLDSGAAALSVLTERNFFAGEPEFLMAVRRAYPEARLLMKDFMLDPWQLELARGIGADCVLLIAALLGRRTGELLALAREKGLSVLVEVHTEAELELARKAGATLVGVNSRDLKTLATDLDVARRLAPLGRGLTLVAESGIKSAEDLRSLKALGYQGFLVGTSLMKGGSLKELLA